ncbi:MAG: hypothetical protein K2X66_00605 [Cyanobacteria bacterium]|nr:hypothetical protein [Cyanobacteriota bacterium]
MGNRWYDKDPALSSALEHLRKSSDAYQAQVAMNIIKVIIEHHIENNVCVELDRAAGLSLMEGFPHVNESLITGGNLTSTDIQEAYEANLQASSRRRWYDVNETLRSAMQLLRDCPDDLQQKIIPTLTRMIEETLEEPFPI